MCTIKLNTLINIVSINIRLNKMYIRRRLGQRGFLIIRAWCPLLVQLQEVVRIQSFFLKGAFTLEQKFKMLRLFHNNIFALPCYLTKKLAGCKKPSGYVHSLSFGVSQSIHAIINEVPNQGLQQELKSVGANLINIYKLISLCA